jgi:hypothetical protein
VAARSGKAPGARKGPGAGDDPRTAKSPGAGHDLRPVGRWLVMVQKAHRGSVETQFVDVLYYVRGLHRQSGSCDLALRGLAVGYAVDTDFRPSVRVGSRMVDTLPDPRASVRTLLGEGVAVLVEEPDLVALGRTAPERLLPGVRVLEPGGLASSWPRYEQVWFL